MKKHFYLAGISQTGGCWIGRGKGYSDFDNAMAEVNKDRKEGINYTSVFTIETDDFNPVPYMIDGMIFIYSMKDQVLLHPDSAYTIREKILESYQSFQEKGMALEFKILRDYLCVEHRDISPGLLVDVATLLLNWKV